MPFCYSPWTNIDISPSGNLSPCCKYRDDARTNQFNIKTNTIDEYKDSGWLSNIKDTFNSGNWPVGCNRCRIEEQAKIESKRQLDYQRWQHHYNNCDINNTGFITASIAFGNTCNLTCITCNPKSSSRWQREYEVIYGGKIQPFHFYKENFVQDFVAQAPDMVHIDIPGGEPFLSGVAQQIQMLEHYVSTGAAANISLHYTTNATVFPDSNWWELWKHFKEVEIQVSIDGVQRRFEYIRYPAKWETVKTCVQQYIRTSSSNLKLSVSHTVSAYNIYYLDEFLSWIESIRLPTPWLGRVHSPAHMRPTVWPTAVKNVIVDKLAQSNYTSDIAPWIELLTTVDDSNYYADFCRYLALHDQYRGLTFKDVFPEMAKIT